MHYRMKPTDQIDGLQTVDNASEANTMVNSF